MPRRVVGDPPTKRPRDGESAVALNNNTISSTPVASSVAVAGSKLLSSRDNQNTVQMISSSDLTTASAETTTTTTTAASPLVTTGQATPPPPPLHSNHNTSSSSSSGGWSMFEILSVARRLTEHALDGWRNDEKWHRCRRDADGTAYLTSLTGGGGGSSTTNTTAAGLPSPAVMWYGEATEWALRDAELLRFQSTPSSCVAESAVPSPPSAAVHTGTIAILFNNGQQAQLVEYPSDWLVALTTTTSRNDDAEEEREFAQQQQQQQQVVYEVGDVISFTRHPHKGCVVHLPSSSSSSSSLSFSPPPLRRRLVTLPDEDDRVDAAARTARASLEWLVRDVLSKPPGLPQYTAFRQGVRDGHWDRLLSFSEVLVPTAIRWLENSQSGKQTKPLTTAEIVAMQRLKPDMERCFQLVVRVLVSWLSNEDLGVCPSSSSSLKGEEETVGNEVPVPSFGALLPAFDSVALERFHELIGSPLFVVLSLWTTVQYEAKYGKSSATWLRNLAGDWRMMMDEPSAASHTQSNGFGDFFGQSVARFARVTFFALRSRQVQLLSGSPVTAATWARSVQALGTALHWLTSLVSDNEAECVAQLAPSSLFGSEPVSAHILHCSRQFLLWASRNAAASSANSDGTAATGELWFPHRCRPQILQHPSLSLLLTVQTNRRALLPHAIESLWSIPRSWKKLVQSTQSYRANSSSEPRPLFLPATLPSSSSSSATLLSADEIKSKTLLPLATNLHRSLFSALASAFLVEVLGQEQDDGEGAKIVSPQQVTLSSLLVSLSVAEDEADQPPQPDHITSCHTSSSTVGGFDPSKGALHCFSLGDEAIVATDLTPFSVQGIALALLVIQPQEATDPVSFLCFVDVAEAIHNSALPSSSSSSSPLSAHDENGAFVERLTIQLLHDEDLFHTVLDAAALAQRFSDSDSRRGTSSSSSSVVRLLFATERSTFAELVDERLGAHLTAPPYAGSFAPPSPSGTTTTSEEQQQEQQRLHNEWNTRWSPVAKLNMLRELQAVADSLDVQEGLFRQVFYSHSHVPLLLQDLLPPSTPKTQEQHLDGDSRSDGLSNEAQRKAFQAAQHAVTNALHMNALSPSVVEALQQAEEQQQHQANGTQVLLGVPGSGRSVTSAIVAVAHGQTEAHRRTAYQQQVTQLLVTANQRVKSETQRLLAQWNDMSGSHAGYAEEGSQMVESSSSFASLLDAVEEQLHRFSVFHADLRQRSPVLLVSHDTPGTGQALTSTQLLAHSFLREEGGEEEDRMATAASITTMEGAYARGAARSRNAPLCHTVLEVERQRLAQLWRPLQLLESLLRTTTVPPPSAAAAGGASFPRPLLYAPIVQCVLPQKTLQALQERYERAVSKTSGTTFGSSSSSSLEAVLVHFFGAEHVLSQHSVQSMELPLYTKLPMFPGDLGLGTELSSPSSSASSLLPRMLLAAPLLFPLQVDRDVALLAKAQSRFLRLLLQRLYWNSRVLIREEECLMAHCCAMEWTAQTLRNGSSGKVAVVATSSHELAEVMAKSCSLRAVQWLPMRESRLVVDGVTANTFAAELLLVLQNSSRGALITSDWVDPSSFAAVRTQQHNKGGPLSGLSHHSLGTEKVRRLLLLSQSKAVGTPSSLPHNGVVVVVNTLLRDNGTIRNRHFAALLRQLCDAEWKMKSSSSSSSADADGGASSQGQALRTRVEQGELEESRSTVLYDDVALWCYPPEEDDEDKNTSSVSAEESGGGGRLPIPLRMCLAAAVEQLLPSLFSEQQQQGVPTVTPTGREGRPPRVAIFAPPSAFAEDPLVSSAALSSSASMLQGPIDDCCRWIREVLFSTTRGFPEQFCQQWPPLMSLSTSSSSCEPQEEEEQQQYAVVGQVVLHAAVLEPLTIELLANKFSNSCSTRPALLLRVVQGPIQQPSLLRQQQQQGSAPLPPYDLSLVFGLGSHQTRRRKTNRTKKHSSVSGEEMEAALQAAERSWLASVILRTRSGLVVVARKEGDASSLGSHCSAAIEVIQRFIAQLESEHKIIHNNNNLSVTETAVAVASRTASHAAFALRCHAHAGVLRCCVPVALSPQQQQQQQSLFQSGVPFRTLGVTACQSLCLQRYQQCEHPAHKCLLPCHGMSWRTALLLQQPGQRDPTTARKEEEESRAVVTDIVAHLRCPYPCPKLLPCGHQCQGKCGDGECQTCRVEQRRTLPCGSYALVGTHQSTNSSSTMTTADAAAEAVPPPSTTTATGEIVMAGRGAQLLWRWFPHHQQLRCGEEPTPCTTWVNLRCPCCGSRVLTRCWELGLHRQQDNEEDEGGWTEATMSNQNLHVDVAPRSLYCGGCVSILHKIEEEAASSSFPLSCSSKSDIVPSSSVGSYLEATTWRDDWMGDWPIEWKEKVHKALRLSLAKQELLLTKAALQLSTTTVSANTRQDLQRVVMTLQQQQRHDGTQSVPPPSSSFLDPATQELLISLGFQLPFALCDEEYNRTEEAMLHRVQEVEVQATARAEWVHRMQSALGRQKEWNETVAMQCKALVESLQ